jgi:hypothetical protein
MPSLTRVPVAYNSKTRPSFQILQNTLSKLSKGRRIIPHRAPKAATVDRSPRELQVAVSVTADVMPGLVSLPDGWGHNRGGSQLQTKTPEFLSMI